MSMVLLWKIGIVVAVLVGSGGGFYLIKKFGLSIVNISQSIVAFVKSTLLSLDITTEDNNFDDILDIIIQALVYVQAISIGVISIDEKIEKALEYINNIASQVNIKFSEDEITIIQVVLRLGFLFMDALGVTTKTVTLKNYVKLYKRMTKHIAVSEKLNKVGLRK